MGIFKDMLGSDETLFKNPIALDYDYMPKLIPFRENEQHYIANCIKPLFMQRNGRNLIITGPPGVGQTVACKHVLMELEEETDEIIPLYINCWQKNTTYKIMYELCELLGLKFIQNKKTDELFAMLRKILNKKSAVFVFDEIDKVEDYDFLYTILEEIYRKTIILITNYSNWITSLDERIKSRLLPDITEFRKYNARETREILLQRVNYAFVPNVWEDEAFDLVVSHVASIGDIRTGLYLLKESGNYAEDDASRKIKVKHAEKALSKLVDFSVKSASDLDEETQQILEIIKETKGGKIGDLFRIYLDKGGKSVYKTFQRKIKKLEEGKFITVKKITGGKEGKTSIIKPAEVKKLTDF